MEQALSKAPFTYPQEQKEYYLGLYHRYEHGSQQAWMDLHDPRLHFFTHMKEGERQEYLVDASLQAEARNLCTVAKAYHVVTLEMNGGLGTSLGMDLPKGESKASGIMFDIHTPDGRPEKLSILEAKMLWATRHAKNFASLGIIPWNNVETQEGWERTLDRIFFNDRLLPISHPRTYRDVAAELDMTIYDQQLQYPFPRLHEKIPMSVGAVEQRYAPGGHGQILYQLYFQGMLQELPKNGVQVLVLVNADNVSAKPNPFFVAHMMEHSVPAAAVTTDRRPIDAKGGIFVVREGRLELIELAQVPSEQREEFQAIGLHPGHVPQPFNTNSIYINIPQVVRFLDAMQQKAGKVAVRKFLTPDLIVNQKKIALDDGSSIDVEQLEGAIGSVIVRFPRMKLFHVGSADRYSEFAPIKTAADVDFLYKSGKFRFDPECAKLFPQG
ncbi:MAG: UTP--glucose-1-phosphate uridylyltransferase [Deltaproteobacteria bacterium]|nr:UTP--glucose-1-phosphate uridylyltransferase [Deltaproteobacteria bacterium]